MATEVRLTRRIHKCVTEALQKKECPTDLKEELAEYEGNDDDSRRAAIPFRLVQKLWEYLGKLSKDTGEKHHSLHLHELLEGSEVYVEPPKPPQRSADLVARLERLKAEQEQREYQKMVRNVDSNWKSGKKSESDTVRSTSKQVSSIFNFILSLIGTFIFGYMASQYALTIPLRVLFGISLAVIVGLAELYFMSRTEI